MLRDPSLVPLSRQHQHALALCVRIERAHISDAELAVWCEEIERHFAQEIRDHFAAEEAVVFPVARRVEALEPVINELTAEHVRLRKDFERARAGTMSVEQVREFARQLAEHVRKEERQLFEGMQAHLTPAEMEGVGRKLAEALAHTDESCLLADERTRLRPKGNG